MYIDDYLAVQSLQSRISIYTDSRCALRIAEDLFEHSDCVSLSVKGSHNNAECTGYDEVRAYWEEFDRRILKNGDTLGSNLAVNQEIRFSPDGDTAEGRWYTYTVDIEGPAYGAAEPPYRYLLSIGRYDNTFARTKDGWKIRKLCWRPLIGFEPYEISASADGTIRQAVEDWPKPYELYEGGTSSCGSGDMSDDDIAWCDAVISVKNLMARFVECRFTGKTADAAETFFVSDAITVPSFFLQGMPAAMVGKENLDIWFAREEKKAGYLDGYAPVDLLTSGAVEPYSENSESSTACTEPYTRARASWASLTLTPLRVSDGSVTYSNATSRWTGDFAKEDGIWKIQSLSRVSYATMPDLTGKRIDE